MFPSGPGANSVGDVPGPVANSTIVPAGVILPMAFVAPRSANHTAPSAPSAIPFGTLPARRPVVNSVIAPVGVMRPMAGVAPTSVNQTLPSAPAVIP